MNEEKLLSDLRVAWEYTHLHEEWVSPLEDELRGLTAAEAAWRTGPDAPSIWEIVLHMAVWNENIVERIESGANVHPAEGAWPALPLSLGDGQWEAAMDRLRRSIGLVDSMLSSVTLAKIEASPYGLPDLLVRYIHMGYHIGQIVKLREELARRSSLDFAN